MGYGSVLGRRAPVLAAPAIEALLGVEPPLEPSRSSAIGKPLTPPKPSSRRPVEDVLEFR